MTTTKHFYIDEWPIHFILFPKICLWGCLKNKFSRDRPDTIIELKTRKRVEINSILANASQNSIDEFEAQQI